MSDSKYMAINAVVALGASAVSGILIAEQTGNISAAVIAIAGAVFAGIRDLKSAMVLRQNEQ